MIKFMVALFSWGWFKKSTPKKPNGKIIYIGKDQKMDVVNDNGWVKDSMGIALKQIRESAIEDSPLPVKYDNWNSN